MNNLVLSIDTSCDDTSAAVVCGQEIWSNVIASQTDLHRPYGGVFPTIAKQAHKENIELTVKMSLKRAGVTIDQISKIAVTIGPGLAPALEVGIDYAKQLAKRYQLPLMPVNHIEGHVLSVLAKPRLKTSLPRHSGFNPESQNLLTRHAELVSVSRTESLGTKITIIHPTLPALSIIVSGKHTEFILVEPVANGHEKPIDIRHSGLVSGSSTESLVAKKAINQPKTSNLPSIPLDRQPRLSLAPDPLDPHLPWLNSGQFTYTILGQTLDDAAGECLDKVGRMLNLGYPAAPVMEQLAKLGDPNRYSFPLPMTTSHDYHLSFAGLKTHARRLIESEFGNQPPTKQQTYDFCASFQSAVFRHITYKLSKVLGDYPQIQEVWLGGGVAANMSLRKSIRQKLNHPTRRAELIDSRHPELVSGSSIESLGTQIAKNRSTLTFRVPYTKRLCQDNAGMGGVTVNQRLQW